MSAPKSSATADTSAAAAWANTVRELLLQVWGEQACQRASDWPDVRQRLLEQLATVVESAVAELARLFGDGLPPDDPTLTVWRTFSKLDRVHCARLAAVLIEASAASPQRKTEPREKVARRKRGSDHVADGVVP
jgi:hypothetical protein